MGQLFAQFPARLRQRVVLFGDSWFERFLRGNGVVPFADHVRSCADQVDVLAVGGDRLQNALWRSRQGRAVEALRAAGMAMQTDVFILLGLNDVTARGKSSDVVGGLYALGCELKAGLGEGARIHILEVPLLPMFDRGMREEASDINRLLKNVCAEAGFNMPGWDPCLLGRDGTVMPRWLISRNDVHLNAEGYEVFARYLRSLIKQGLQE